MKIRASFIGSALMIVECDNKPETAIKSSTFVILLAP